MPAELCACIHRCSKEAGWRREVRGEGEEGRREGRKMGIEALFLRVVLFEQTCCRMIRVLTTSRGVVMAAAAPPAIEPHTEPCHAGKSFTLISWYLATARCTEVEAERERERERQR